MNPFLRALVTATHLGEVLPRVGYRQWTLTLPRSLRWVVAGIHPIDTLHVQCPGAPGRADARLGPGMHQVRLLARIVGRAAAIPSNTLNVYVDCHEPASGGGCGAIPAMPSLVALLALLGLARRSAGRGSR